MDVVLGNNLNSQLATQSVEAPQASAPTETETQVQSTEDVVTISAEARELQQRSGDDNGTKPK